MNWPESKIIQDFEDGKSTWGWLFNDLRMLYHELDKDDGMLERIKSHTNREVVKAAKQIIEMEIGHSNIEKDLESIRIKLNLYKGRKIKLSGGYESNPFWLNNNECHISEFIKFVPYSEDKPPILIAKLEKPIQLATTSGYQYKGSIILARTSDWLKKTTAIIYVVEVEPENMKTYIESSPIMIEDHASWELI